MNKWDHHDAIPFLTPPTHARLATAGGSDRRVTCLRFWCLTFSLIAITFAPPTQGQDRGHGEGPSDANVVASTGSIVGAGIPVPSRILEFTPALTFSEIEIGRTETRSLTLRNSGNTNLQVTSLTVPSGFAGTFSGTIQPAGIRTVPIAFIPSSTGTFSGTIVIHSDATTTTNEVQVTGTARSERSRILELNGDLAFGAVEVDQHATHALILTNSGEASILVTSIVFPPSFSGAFAGLIPAAGRRSVEVTFAPRSTGQVSGAIVVIADHNGGVSSLPISGTGTRRLGRIIAVNDLAFGEIPNRTQATRSLVISNLGEASFTVAGLALPPGFTGTFSGAVPPGGSRSATITFSPQEVRDYLGAIEVESDANTGDKTASVSGRSLPAPLFPTAGNYGGLFYEPDGVRHHSSGLFNLKVDTKGAYSAKLFLAGKSLAASGRFAFDGTATNVLNLGRPDMLRIVWATDPNTVDTVGGIITSTTWEAYIAGRRVPFDRMVNPTPQAGQYTLVFPGQPAQSTAPEGDGFASMTIDSAGKTVLAGTLADGTKLTFSGSILGDGNCPFYAGTTTGSILGWLNLGPQGARDVSGVVSWIRLPATSTKVRLYPAGFVVGSEAVGFRYTPPAAKSPRIAGATAGRLTLQGLNLPSTLETPFVFNSKNQLVPSGPEKLTLTLNPKTGQWMGKRTPAASKTAVSFLGILLQPTNSLPSGTGFFIGSDASGHAGLDLDF